jgi:hypothetical protein
VDLFSQDPKLILRYLVLDNHSYLEMLQRSEVETFPNVLTIPLVKLIGHGNARAARHWETLPKIKQDQKQYPLDACTASKIRDVKPQFF